VPGGSFLKKAPVIYLLPAVTVLLAFAGYPLLVLIRMALSDVGPTNIVGAWHWIGLDNLAEVLANPEFWQALLRTGQLAGALLVTNLVLGFLGASTLTTRGRLTDFVLGLMVFVWALPPLVTGSVWKFLADGDGAINAVLGAVGIPPVGWLSSPDIAIWTVTGVLAWAGLPFSVLVLRGGLLGISADILEAAALDGAGYWRMQLQVVLPMLRPSMWILGILTVLYAFKSFDFIYVLTSGGPGTATTTLPVMSYFTAFSNFNMGVGAAIAVIALVVVAVLAVPYTRSIRKEVVE